MQVLLCLKNPLYQSIKLNVNLFINLLNPQTKVSSKDMAVSHGNKSLVKTNSGPKKVRYGFSPHIQPKFNFHCQII